MGWKTEQASAVQVLRVLLQERVPVWACAQFLKQVRQQMIFASTACCLSMFRLSA
jgi:hypothetical protein